MFGFTRARIARMRLTAVVRILTGILFVAEGLSKVTGDFVSGEFAKEAPQIAARSFPFWRHFLETVVVPHARSSRGSSPWGSSPSASDCSRGC